MRKARKGRDYTALRDLGVRAVDDVFKMAAPLLREAADLKENMQVGVFHYFDITFTFTTCLFHILLFPHL